MICDFGDVVVVPFPFVDAQVVKHRPALVLSNRVFNASSGQSVLAMITSANQSTWPTDLEIADLEQAGLKHYSVVRWKLFTLVNSTLLAVIDKLSDADEGAVAQALVRNFGNGAR